LIPGKKYKPEDFLEVAWRRRWIVAVPFVLIALATFVYSQLLPNEYRSSATILVIPPQVPENYVRPAVSETLKERLDLMRKQIMSQTQLERIINEFNLYPKERKTLLMDQVTMLMARDINIDVPRTARREDPGSFAVSFDYEIPRTAMQVTERLSSLFIKANLEGRSIQADATTQFLQSQVDETLRKLQEQDAKIQTFRKANAGRLPSDVQSNLQFMQTSAQQLEALTSAINHARDRQIVIERTLADEAAIAAAAAPAPSRGTQAAAEPTSQQLAEARTALASMQLRMTDDHPDVRAMKRHIAELEQKAAQDDLQRPVSDGTTAAPVAGTLSSAQVEQARRISSLRSEHESLGRDIAAKTAELNRLQAAAGQYKERIEVAPMLEGEYSQLTRDYDTLQQTYTNLLKKLQDAKVASNLEQRQVGEQFRLLDPPRVPELPASPNRLRMNMIGSLGGLAFGLGIAALLEYRDTALRTEDDVMVALSLPVVALVPTMLSDEERRRRRRRGWLLASSAALTVLMSAAALIWKLRVR
jgi:polysaccharide chain length determinant protein (PEP-CTERM system associated)